MPKSRSKGLHALLSPDLAPFFGTDAEAPWWEHAPVARWLLDEVRPGLAVAADGSAALAVFRNAAGRGDGPWRVLGVTGQDRAGRPGERPADAARPPELADMADGSVDLLHLDTLPSGSAAWDRLATAVAKMTEAGVVLLDGIGHPGSPVAWAWGELKADRPSVAFPHGRGLGIVAVGRRPPDLVVELAALPPKQVVSLRSRIAQIGGRMSGREAAPPATERTAPLRRPDRTEDRPTISALNQVIGTLEGQVKSLSGEASSLRDQLDATHASFSWRVTAPYRLFRVRARRLRGRSQAERQESRDYETISRAGLFDARFYRGVERHDDTVDDPLRHYLERSRAAVPRARPDADIFLRRPAVGFHPNVYASDCAAFDEASGEDPLAHYIRTGRPPGRWANDVLTVSGATGARESGLRAVLHAHFHYLDHVTDLLGRLAANASTPDLFVTTTDAAKGAAIERILSAAGRHDDRVLVVPNAGRDIGPLLTNLREVEGYDVVGHVHGKRSPQHAAAYADNWRTFLWDHVVGAPYPTMDAILARFEADETLGLVFPEDPNLSGWDHNLDRANAIAERLGIARPLPAHFDFPKGTMFWGRPAALAALGGLGLSANDFPVEPIAPDGTLLHTLERLIPFSTALAGLEWATTHVPDVLRHRPSHQS